MSKMSTEPRVESKSSRPAVAEDAAYDILTGLRMIEYRIVFLLLADLLGVAIALTMAVAVSTYLPLISGISGESQALATSSFFVLGLAVVLTFRFAHLYRWKINQSSFDELSVIAGAAASAAMVALLISRMPWFGPPLVVEIAAISWLLMIVLLPLTRSVARGVLGRVHVVGASRRRALIVGAGNVGQIMAEKFRRRQDLGLDLIGFVDSSPPKNAQLGLSLLGKEEDLLNLVRLHDINHVILAFSPSSHDRLLRMIRRCDRVGVSFSIVPRLFEITYFSDADEIEGVPLVNLRKSPAGKAERLVKRVIDMGLAAVSVALLAPLFAAIAVFIKLDSRGPVFFRQERVGKDGKRFMMLKFRSMEAGAHSKQRRMNHLNQATGPLFKIREDPRLTRMGIWLRKFSLDELPQLFNVLSGKMSLVGPRPPLPEEVKRYSGWHKRRLAAVPGITGLWQVLGRSDLTFEEMVKLDYLYLRNYSLRLDLKILAQTVPAVMSRRGAY